MKGENHRQTTNRRTVLKQLGAAGILGGAGLSSVASAQPSSGEGPVRARGTKLVKAMFDSETITVEEWYISPDLQKRYGNARLLFEQEKYSRELLENALGKELPKEGQSVTRHNLDKLVGTESEWQTHYEGLKNKQSQEIGTTSKSDYTGPVYEFKKSGSGQYTTSAPINAIFEAPSRSLSEITNKMNSWSRWTNSDDCGQNRYVFMDQGFGGYFAKQHAQLGTDHVCLDPRDHIRLWYDEADPFGDTNGQFKIGSIHHDPAGHTCIKEFGYPYYTFEPPEQRFKNDWSNNTAATVGSIDLNNAESWNQCKEANDDYAAYINW